MSPGSDPDGMPLPHVGLGVAETTHDQGHEAIEEDYRGILKKGSQGRDLRLALIDVRLELNDNVRGL